MAVGSYIDLNVTQAAYYAKTLKKFQGTQSSIIATPYKFLSREQIAARRSRQWLTEIAAAWKVLDAPTKATWKTYAANIHRTNWSLYCQEYAYRKKYDLSYPPDPTQHHQMMGLQISNPDGSGTVTAKRYDIAVQGEITVTFSYKKTENAPTGGLPFRVHAIAYYFEQGENKSEESTFDAPSGNVGWTQEDFTFGTADRYYFELIITFELTDYDADVILDNFTIEDELGNALEEPWHIKAGQAWIYQIKTRKEGWEFSPGIGAPYIQIVYTGS